MQLKDICVGLEAAMLSVNAALELAEAEQNHQIASRTRFVRVKLAEAMAMLQAATPGYTPLPRTTQEAEQMLAVSRRYLLAHQPAPTDSEGGEHD